MMATLWCHHFGDPELPAAVAIMHPSSIRWATYGEFQGMGLTEEGGKLDGRAQGSGSALGRNGLSRTRLHGRFGWPCHTPMCLFDEVARIRDKQVLPGHVHLREMDSRFLL